MPINGDDGNAREVVGARLEHEDRPQDNDRREFLEKYGKLAIYTPPAIMALMFYGERSARADSSFPKNPFRWSRSTSRSRSKMG
jgi:hypothetical protein